MNNKDFTISILVDQTPMEAFDAINDVRGWWHGEIEGRTEKLNDEFTYKYKKLHYTKQRLTEVIPGKKVVWLVIDSTLNFVEDKTEWTGTRIIFEIERVGDKTQVRFTHQGLVPTFQCYGDCSNAWSGIVSDDLRELIISRKDGNAATTKKVRQG